MRGRAAQRRGERRVRDAQRLQHVLEVHRLDRVAQRHVDADQHGAQFVVGQHHAHRHVAPARLPAMRPLRPAAVRCGPGYGTPAAASASLCRGAVTSAAISPRRAARAAQTTHSAAAVPAAALDLAPGDRLRRCGHLQHRDAARRRRQRLRRRFDQRHRQRRPPWRAAWPARRAASRHVAGDEAALRQRPGRPRKALAMISRPDARPDRPCVIATERDAACSCRVVDRR